MKLVYKVNLAVLGLLVFSAALVGVFFVSSFRSIKAETYRWFDASAGNLASTVGNQAKEALTYFDYKAIEDALKKQVQGDKNLLFIRISFGKELKEAREAGSAAAGPHRAAEVEIKDEDKVVARVTVHYATAVLEQKLSALVWRLTLGAGLTLALLLVTLYLLVLQLVNRPLLKIIDHAHVTAGGNLTTTVDVRASDEFVNLAGTLNKMTDNIREIVKNVRRAFGDLNQVSTDITDVSHRIADGSQGQASAVATVSSSIEEMNASIKSVVQSVEHLFTLAGESSSSMLEMAASVEQVAVNAEGLSGAVEKTSSSIAQMTVSIRNVAENVGRLADLVASTSSSITEIDSVVREVERNSGQGHELSREVARTMTEEGLVGLRRTAEGMLEIRTSVSEAADVIRGLEARSHEIGSILGVVNEVNDQTNLLALNAAILAAQAGEHGRGFAVVAEEIRELSARTASSTKEITRLIQSVQKEAKNAVAAMDNGTQSVENGTRIVEELGETLKRAAEDSEKASAASRIIALSTTEQYKGIKQISASAQRISEMSQEIARATREQSAGSTEIMRASEEMRELAMQVKRAMSEQAKGIKLTSRASEESARLSQQVLEASREEARASELVVKNIGAIQDVTVSNAEAVKKLDQMVGVLGAQAEYLAQEIGRFKID
jgi:methyl-accepting chemotaxis protein